MSCDVYLAIRVKGYSEAVYRQDTESFIRVLEDAFWALGGVPRRVVFANANCAVKTPDYYDPELNPKLTEFCKHYQSRIYTDTSTYTEAQGEGRTGRRLHSGECPSRTRVPIACRAERIPRALGENRSRHTDPWHHLQACAKRF
jgi:transposase